MTPKWIGFPLMAGYVSLFAGWNVLAEWATGGIALPAVLVLCGGRALIASALMFASYLARTRCGRGSTRALCPPRAHLKRIATAGVLRSFTSAFFGVGLSMAGSVNASVLHSTVPGITALVAIVKGYEKLSWRRLGGIFLAMVGALIVLGAEELASWHKGTDATRHLGTGTTDDALAYLPKNDPSRSVPQDRAITVSGVSTHDLHFSRAHVGLLMLAGYCTTYVGYYMLMHALTRLKSGGSGRERSAADSVRVDGSPAAHDVDDDDDDAAAATAERAEVVASAAARSLEDAEPTPPSSAVSAEQPYAPDHMMALLQLASGSSTVVLLALYALVGAVAPEDLAHCWTWTFGVAMLYGSVGLSVFAYLAEMITIRLLGAAMTSLGIALDPPMTLIFGAIFLRHKLNPYIIPGVVLIAIGVVTSAMAKAAAEQKSVVAPPPEVELRGRGLGATTHHRVATSEEHAA